MKLHILTCVNERNDIVSVRPFFSLEKAREEMKRQYDAERSDTGNLEIVETFSRLAENNAVLERESDDEYRYLWQITETDLEPESAGGIPVCKIVTGPDLVTAEKILRDNGIAGDETPTVLQAVGYALLDTELYPAMSRTKALADAIGEEPQDIELRIESRCGRATIKGYLTSGRVKKRHALPGGYFAFGIRHSDNDDGIPATIETDVIVNHYGDLLLKKDDRILVESLLVDRDFIKILDWNIL